MSAPSRASRTAEARACRRRAALGAGGLVDAEPVRVHVRMLQSSGLGVERIAALASLSGPTVQCLLSGQPWNGRPPTQRMERANAAALLAIRPDLDHVAELGRVDATGTRRRLQGLVAVGWSQQQLADRLAVQHRQVRYFMAATSCSARTARRVLALAAEMAWELPPTATAAQRAGVTRTKAYAAARGWSPLLAWDDDTIDDPAAVPDLGAVPQSAVDLDDDEHLRAAGVPDEEIAARMGVTLDGLQVARRRARLREAS